MDNSHIPGKVNASRAHYLRYYWGVPRRQGKPSHQYRAAARAPSNRAKFLAANAPGPVLAVKMLAHLISPSFLDGFLAGLIACDRVNV